MNTFIKKKSSTTQEKPATHHCYSWNKSNMNAYREPLPESCCNTMKVWISYFILYRSEVQQTLENPRKKMVTFQLVTEEHHLEW